MNMYPIYPIWMRDELSRSGTKLLLYANIYRNGQQTFNLPLLTWWCGVSSFSVRRPINELIRQGLLMREKASNNTLTLRAVRPAVLVPIREQECEQKCEQKQKCEQMCEQMCEQSTKDKERSKEKEIKNNNFACVKEKSASAQGEILNGKDKFVAPE